MTLYRSAFLRGAAAAALCAPAGRALATNQATGSGQTAIVLNSDEASMSVVDRTMFKELRRLPVGREPHHFILSLDGKDLLIGSTVTNELTFVDPVSGTERRRVKNIIDPYQLGFSPDGKWFVAAALRLNHVDVYTSDFRLVKRIPLGLTPSHIAFDRDSRFAFVTMQDSNKLAAVDLSTQAVAWQIDVGATPAGIQLLPNGEHLAIGLMGEDFFSIVDWRKQTVVKRLVTGKGAHQAAIAPDRKTMYCTNRVDGTISVVDLTAPGYVVAAQIKTGGWPDCMDFSPDGKQLWVTLRTLKKVGAVDLAARKLVGTANVGRSPHGVFVSRPDHFLRHDWHLSSPPLKQG
jgi:DNA-binding beta-propeller fold protein YncE